MIKALTFAAVTTAIVASPALAGTTQPAIPEATVAPALTFTSSSPDWTGFYIGGQAGYADVDGSGIAFSDDGFIGGLTAGYDYDFGTAVIGAAIDYDWTDLDLLPASSLENILRLKLRGGYKIGNGLLYGTGGYAQAETNNLGSADGYFIGAGYEYLINEQFSVGGEVLYHDFDSFAATGADADATTVQVRATFRF